MKSCLAWPLRDCKDGLQVGRHGLPGAMPAGTCYSPTLEEEVLPPTGQASQVCGRVSQETLTEAETEEASAEGQC